MQSTTDLHICGSSFSPVGDNDVKEDHGLHTIMKAEGLSKIYEYQIFHNCVGYSPAIYTAVGEYIPENKQFAGDGATIRCSGSQMLLGHSLQHAHEGSDESVNESLVMHARRLKDHQCTKQLRVSSARRLLIGGQTLIHNLA